MAKAFGGLGTTAGLAADRTSMTGMVAGQQFFETDTKFVYTYDGSAWYKTDYVGVRPAFHVEKNNGNVAAGSTVVWNGVKFDTTSSYSTSTGRFTAPVTGTYQISVWAMSNSPSAYFRIDFYKNASVYMQGYNEASPTTTGYHHVSISAPIQMNSGDYIYMQAGGNTMYGTYQYNGFTGYFLG